VTQELQQTRYDRLLRRVGGMVGGGSKVSEVIAELFPMIDVENVPGELLGLMGTDLCMGGGTIVGIAGQAPRTSIENPAGSGKLITVTDFWVSSTNSVIVRWGISNQSLANRLTTEVFRDTRKFAPNLPLGQIHQVSSVALAPATMQTRVLANTTLQISDENGIAVLAPGTNLQVGLNVLTSTILYGFYWRERIAEQSELNF